MKSIGQDLRLPPRMYTERITHCFRRCICLPQTKGCGAAASTIRIAEIDAEFQKMLKSVSADNADGIDEERITELMNEKQRLTVQIEQYAAMRQKRESAKSRLDEIFTILDGLQNHPMEYDDKLVRQIIECVVVESKEKIKVVFIGGTEIEMVL